ncbi:unannotated protein [freshwater metagenome]|uniref:Unannotated protein n=1 Tax=freshwater metagenome TaxID=449393 RepID=A0A6J7K2Y2_9ZZZZ
MEKENKLTRSNESRNTDSRNLRFIEGAKLVGKLERSFTNLVLTKLVLSARNISYKSLKHLEIPLRIRNTQKSFMAAAKSERGDVPGWVLVVLMTTGLVTGIWTVAQPRLSSILKNSLDNMNSIR